MNNEFDVIQHENGNIIEFRDLEQYVKGVSSSYLIKGKSINILIDCLSGRFDLFEKLPQDLPLVILLTHAHVDHIGGLVNFANKSNIDIYIHQYELEFVLRGIDMHPEIRKKQIVKFFKNNEDRQPNFIAVPTVKPLQDKTIFQFGKGDKEYIVAIHTPAHTNGSMCFYTPSFGGCLFTGDTYYYPEKQFSTYGFEKDYKLQTQHNQIIRLYEEYHDNLQHVFTGHNGDQKDEFFAFVKRKQKRNKISTLECCICGIRNVLLYFDEKQTNLIFCGKSCQKIHYQ